VVELLYAGGLEELDGAGAPMPRDRLFAEVA
jgi:hypothetical protein